MANDQPASKLKTIENNIFSIAISASSLTDKETEENMEKYCAKIEELRNECQLVKSNQSIEVRNFKKEILQNLDTLEENLDKRILRIKEENSRKRKLEKSSTSKENPHTKIRKISQEFIEETKKRLGKIEESLKQIQNLLDDFNGTKLEDSYFVIDKEITEKMIEVDSIPHNNNKEIKTMRRNLLCRLEEFSTQFDLKCKNAPPTLTNDEREEKIEELNQIIEELKILKKKIEEYKTEFYEEIDDGLVRLFLRTKQVDGKTDYLVEEERKKVIKEVQDTMLQLANKNVKQK